MNVLQISIDSLRRDFLSAYSAVPTVVDYEVETDNLDRFAERAAVFDTHYAGSLPCMPARREWTAGVQEFLWRPWGPIEPFDETLPCLARDAGAVTQFITDHFHYFQHGSHGYYEDYNGFEFVRGHEYDAWKTVPREPDERLLDQTTDPATDPADGVGFLNRAQYARNVDALDERAEADFFAPRVFASTADWLRDAGDWDQWFCYVDSFDVHEPFHLPEPYASMYTDEDPRDPELPNWPYYGRIDAGQSELSDRELEFVRSQFAGKVTMVDRWFGEVLEAIEGTGSWEDTAVIVTADHGFLLGEHGWIAKNEMPVYDALANTPLMIHHPDAERSGDRIDQLTSAVDLYATVLDFLDVSIPEGTHSRSLEPVLAGAENDHREWALYGYWGSSVNVTDGRYTYMRPCDPEEPTDCYSTTMMNPNSWFTPTEPKTDAESGTFLPYTESPVWKFPGRSYAQHDDDRLYDTEADPHQETNLAGESGEEDRMRELLVAALADLDAPEGQFDRLGLEP
ncbi:sulfatase-like hydrolase/transferase [Saliphagus sp. LR7]|uniref:sulfatase-like hydrolase/transferase n=1 Tax=Saliphagus sp. LR7 TaxID=2282654 RepID=UPI000DF7A17A|nr:sulfatase-like hydrolase/transferase [Saliphagus sp. LR7]